MAKSILASSAKIIALTIILSACTEQNVKQEKDLTLPDFSFIGLSEPLSDKKNIKVSVHIKIPYDELQFTRSGDQFFAQYEVGVNIADQNKERIAGQIWSDTLWLNAYKDTRNSTNTILTEKSFIVPASELTINVRVTDLYTKKSNVLSDGLDQSGMYKTELSLGNIMIMDSGAPEGAGLLMDQSFFEIIDTLAFKIRLLGAVAPYSLSYDLRVKEESQTSKTTVIDHDGPIDSLLYFDIPLTDMHYANYTLFVMAEDGSGNQVKTKSNFRVRLRGVNFDVVDIDEAVKQLVYLADDRSIRDLKIGTEEQKLAKFKQFWAALDPTPGTVENELMEEYYRRVAFSIEAFTVVQEGWKTDRGMIYILFGPPDEIQRGPFEINRKPYQVWEYYRIGKQFVFRDETGFGDYRLDQTFLDQNDWRFRY